MNHQNIRLMTHPFFILKYLYRNLARAIATMMMLIINYTELAGSHTMNCLF